MKKVILSAAALLIGGIAFGQVSISTGTASDAQPVPALAGAAVGANTGEAIQIGTAQKVRVRQAGTANSARTVQDDGLVGGGNEAFIRQTGLVQPGISGELNEAEILQSGEANEATSLQEGDRNDSYIAQGATDKTSTGNKARIRQGTGQQAEDNFAAIEQDGDNNQAWTMQTWDNSDAWVRQIGDSNKSMVNQNASPEDSDGHEALVYQLGDENESFITQSGAGGRNVAYAEQTGNGNQSKQYQTTTALAGETGNYGVVLQGRSLIVDAPEVVTAQNIFNNLNTVDPLFNGGTDNTSTNGRALQVQAGKENEAFAVQYGGASFASDYIEQNQDGENNDAFVDQNRGGGADSGGDNYARQDQVGNNNVAGLGQNFSGNKSWQTQYGDDNSVLSTQIGLDNKLNVHQRGDGSRAVTRQHGDNNAALLVQWDGQSFSVLQGDAGAPSFGGEANILQVGPGGNFGPDYQIDCGIEDMVPLDMDYTVPELNLEPVCDGC